jgi:hypothetical protein
MSPPIEKHDLERLKTACLEQTPQTETEAIEIGETTWFMGPPASAPKGTIALAHGEGAKIIIREDDVLEVIDNKGSFLVRVRADSHAMLRIEQVFQARRQHCACDDSSGGPASGEKKVAQTVARSRGSGGGGLPFRECWVELDCWIIVDANGYLREVCVPILRCEPIIWV